MWLWLLLLIAIVVIILYGLKPFATNHQESERDQYVTEEVTLADLTVVVSATGTLQPIKAVDVGSEQSGTLVQVLAQENDRVTKDQILAQLDTTRLQDAVTKSTAALAVAEASVIQAQATVVEAEAALARMRRVSEISQGKVPSQTELETAIAALQRAKANEASAKATVTQAQAALKTDTTNLGKSTIRSPVDGVVLTRNVEPGQTVVASMSTPVLFTIAEDLTNMELQVQVDEADVGHVRVGQTATFTVAAWPSRNFPAEIQRVGIGSTITDNVVTYKTILLVHNDDLSLRPGMTAMASIVTAKRTQVLLVPNSALRFAPDPQRKPKEKTSFLASLVPRRPREPKKRYVQPSEEPQVWILEHNKPKAIKIKTGVSNGRFTEVLEGSNLQPGMEVLTDYREDSSS